MKLTNLLTAAALLSMTTAPAIAAGNPAAPLSVAHSTRASAAATKKSQLDGGLSLIIPIVGLIVLIAAIVVIENDDSKSP